MTHLDSHPTLRKALRTLQIVIGALVLGVLGFLVVALVVHSVRPVRDPGEAEGILTGVLLAVAAVQVVISPLVGSALLGAARRRIASGSWQAPSTVARGPLTAAVEETGDVGRLLYAYTMTRIITAAMIEGGAFLALVAYLLEGQTISLVVAGALGILLAFQMPTRSGVNHWLELELMKLRASQEERSPSHS